MTSTANETDAGNAEQHMRNQLGAEFDAADAAWHPEGETGSEGGGPDGPRDYAEFVKHGRGWLVLLGEESPAAIADLDAQQIAERMYG